MQLSQHRLFKHDFPNWDRWPDVEELKVIGSAHARIS